LRNDMSGAQACNCCYRGLCALRLAVALSSR
jgi:hypothetical protein